MARRLLWIALLVTAAGARAGAADAPILTFEGPTRIALGEPYRAKLHVRNPTAGPIAVSELQGGDADRCGLSGSTFRAVTEGQRVTLGDPIAKSGATGRVTGPHLHFAVRWQGLYLSPATLLALPLA